MTTVRLVTIGGYTRVIEALAVANAAPNASDSCQQTPLHLAAMEDHTKAIEHQLHIGEFIGLLASVLWNTKRKRRS
jgi:NaMN:DMB phosphoribosyltransferase